MDSLIKVIEEYRSILRSKKYLIKLSERLKSERERLKVLSTILDEEYSDVLNLEKLSLNKLFQTILGNFEKQFEIEKQEYLHAFLQFNECKRSINLLEFEQSVLEEKIKGEAQAMEKVEALMRIRDASIEQQYPQLKKQLLDFSHRLDDNFGFKRELNEALIIGLKVKRTFEQMIDLVRNSIKGDEDWGIFEVFKQNENRNSLLDKAQTLSYTAKLQIEEMEVELEDVYKVMAVKRFNKFDELRHFNDIYYDRLISDWIMQRKIQNVLNYLLSTLDKVERIVDTLKIQIKKCDISINYLKDRKKEVIDKALK